MSMTTLETNRTGMIQLTRLAAIAAVSLAAGAARADTPWTLNSSTAGVDEGGSYAPPVFSMTGSPIGTSGIHLSGHLGPVDGSFSGNPDAYIPGLNAIFCTGNMGSTIAPGNTLSTSYNMNFTFSGGVVTLYSIFLSANNGGSFVNGQGLPGGPITPASGQAITGSFSSGAFATSSVGGSWSLSLNFDWQGFAPGDHLTLNLPTNSIDIHLVPTPGAAGLLLVGGLAMGRRRR